MNGRLKGVITCYCGAISPYGAKPDHKPGCGNVGLIWDTQCQCGHWGGNHSTARYSRNNPGPSGEYGCVIEGCKCELNCADCATKKDTNVKCDCGGAKLGYPAGQLHSHWGSSDPAKWCPLRKA